VNKPPRKSRTAEGRPAAVSLAPADMRAGALLTQALVQVAAEHARDRGVSESVVVSALVSALGCVAVSIAKVRGFDLGRYQEFIAGHLAHVFASESRRAVYTIH
jgi:hypothetical protein